MPRLKTHLQAGAVAGTIGSLLTSEELKGDAFLAHAAGCLVGALIGSVLPDKLEPGTSSWHRKLCHSVTLLCAGGVATLNNFPAWVSTRREALAKSQVEWQALPSNAPERVQRQRADALQHFVTGLFIGIVIGYALHLLMDARSPRSLPIF